MGIAVNTFLQTIFKNTLKRSYSFNYVRLLLLLLLLLLREGRPANKEKQDALCWKDKLCPETTTGIVDFPLSER